MRVFAALLAGIALAVISLAQVISTVARAEPAGPYWVKVADEPFETYRHKNCFLVVSGGGMAGKVASVACR